MSTTTSAGYKRENVTPYATEMKIVRRRLQVPLTQVAEEFGLTRAGIINIMKRNADIVAEAKAKMRQDTIDGIIADAKSGEEY